MRVFRDADADRGIAGVVSGTMLVVSRTFRRECPRNHVPIRGPMQVFRDADADRGIAGVFSWTCSWFRGQSRLARGFADVSELTRRSCRQAAMDRPNTRAAHWLVSPKSPPLKRIACKVCKYFAEIRGKKKGPDKFPPVTSVSLVFSTLYSQVTKQT